MKTSAWSQGVSALAQQWRETPRLRLGIWVIGAILWIYALLLVSDRVSADYKAAAELRDTIARTRPLARDPGWKQRAEDAARQRAAAQSLLWQADNLGLAEASFQDWLRSTADKAHLVVKDLNVSRSADASGGAPVSAAAPASAAAAGPVPIRARLTLEFQRTPLLAFLAEVGQSERVIVVDRLQIRTWSQPAAVELDLHVLALAKAGKQ
jgi:hypothetical protein